MLCKYSGRIFERLHHGSKISMNIEAQLSFFVGKNRYIFGTLESATRYINDLIEHGNRNILVQKTAGSRLGPRIYVSSTITADQLHARLQAHLKVKQPPRRKRRGFRINNNCA